MAVVQGGKLRFFQPLDDRQHTGVDDAHPQVGVGGLQSVAALEVSLNRHLDAIGAAEHVLEEGEPDIRREALMAPVIELGEDERGDDQVLACPGDQLGAWRVVGIGGVERRQQRTGVQDQRGPFS